MSKCAYCHKQIIADIQAQTALELPEGTVMIHANPCAILVKRELERTELFKVLAKLSAAIFVILFLTFALKADERGCLCTYNGQNGKFYFEAFIKVADKESPDENGEAEIWGFNVEPGNLEKVHRIENGLVYPVNVRASKWIPADGRRHKVKAGSTERMVKCPPYW